MNQISEFIQSISQKKILILGFGREGKSTYQFIREQLPYFHLFIADRNEIDLSDLNATIICGENYLSNLNQYDLIFKTPGISLNSNVSFDKNRFTSQTDIFLQHFGNQTIGITGTKGKSTTSSLIYHILKESKKDVLFGGNIGIPLFDLIPSINPDTIIVSELSAHQLEFIHKSPHISVLLNLFQEHLDHFQTVENYFNAKWNINKFQEQGDLFIFSAEDVTLENEHQSNAKTTNLAFSQSEEIENGAYIYSNLLIIKTNNQIDHSFSITDLSHLPGKHNLNNIMAAVLACRSQEISFSEIEAHLKTFKGLEHRIEYVGNIDGVDYFNDSISTIPEATISALKALENVTTLVLGGFDRMIDYSKLYEYIDQNPIKNIAFTGPAGKRMLFEWENHNKSIKNFILTDNYNEIILFCKKQTKKNGKCLLSPAAASYDQFKNFEERGTYFKNQIKENHDL